jgi:hypothetical protein
VHRDLELLGRDRLLADFGNPAASTFSGPTLVEVAGYKEICARATTVACIPEPPPGEKVDGLAYRVMFRLAYRNFGDNEALVSRVRPSIPPPTSGWAASRWTAPGTSPLGSMR